MNVTSVTSEDGVKEFEKIVVEPEDIEYVEVNLCYFRSSREPHITDSGRCQKR